jgi:hypothetical protein
VRETVILVEQQPPQGFFVCDHAGLVTNKFSHFWWLVVVEHFGSGAVCEEGF